MFIIYVQCHKCVHNMTLLLEYRTVSCRTSVCPQLSVVYCTVATCLSSHKHQTVLNKNLSKLSLKMGQTGSRVANKIANSFSFSESPSDDYIVEVANSAAVASFKGTPFVFTRRGYVFQPCRQDCPPPTWLPISKCQILTHTTDV